MYLEHVNFTVSDLERSIAFYRDLLGFEVRWRGRTAGGQPAAHVGDGRSYLALFQAAHPAPAGSRPDYEQVGFNHFGFVVEDLAEIRSRLVRMEVTPHLEAGYEPGRRIYFFDPDGIEVELVEYDAPRESPLSIGATRS